MHLFRTRTHRHTHTHTHMHTDILHDISGGNFYTFACIFTRVTYFSLSYLSIYMLSRTQWFLFWIAQLLQEGRKEGDWRSGRASALVAARVTVEARRVEVQIEA